MSNERLCEVGMTKASVSEHKNTSENKNASNSRIWTSWHSPLSHPSPIHQFITASVVLENTVHLPLIFKLVIEFQDDNLCLKKGNLDLDYMTNTFRITKNYYTCSRKTKYLQSKAPCLKFEDLLIQSMQKKNPFQRIFMIFPFSKCLCLIFDQFCCITYIKWVYRHRS